MKFFASLAPRPAMTHSILSSRAEVPSVLTLKSSSVGLTNSPLCVSSTYLIASTTVVLPEPFSPTRAFSPGWKRTSRPGFPSTDLNCLKS